MDQILKAKGLIEVEKFKREINIFAHEKGSSLELLKDMTIRLLFDRKLEINKKMSTESLNPFKSIAYQIENPTQSPICSKNIRLCKDGVIYRCYDCMECDSSILCEPCFVAGNHHNHRFRRL